MFIYNSVLTIYGVLWAKNEKFKKTQEKNFKRFKIYPDFHGGHTWIGLQNIIYLCVVSKYVRPSWRMKVCRSINSKYAPPFTIWVRSEELTRKRHKQNASLEYMIHPCCVFYKLKRKVFVKLESLSNKIKDNWYNRC